MPFGIKKDNQPQIADPGSIEQGMKPLVAPEPEKCSFWQRKNGEGETACKDCGDEATGNYCSNCGQKTNTRRFRFRLIANNFFSAVFNIERGVFKTVLMLFSRPGYMARDYIEGKRRSYTNPFSLMVLLAGIYSILYLIMLWTQSGQTSTLDAMDFNIEAGNIFGGKLSPEVEEIYIRVLKWLVDSAVLLSLTMLPVYTIAIKLFFRRPNRRRFNYTELMYVSAYIAAQRFVIDLAELPFRWIFNGGESFYEFKGVAYFILTVITLHQLFGTSWIGTSLRTIGMFFLSLIFISFLLLGLLLLIFWISTGENMFLQ